VIGFGYVVQDFLSSQAYKPGTNDTEIKFADRDRAGRNTLFRIHFTVL
jgi:hypothetical protein